METSHHMVPIKELDLSVYSRNSLAAKINDAVPGLKTSTAFFTFLRANLVLPPSAGSSNVSTPMLEPHVFHTPAAPSPSPLAANPPQATADDDIPPLSLDILTKHDDKVDALHLVADSIAQQRQQAARHLVFHPLCLCALAAGLAGVYQLGWGAAAAAAARQPQGPHDAGLALALASGALMAYLLAIRWATAGYVRAAEDFGWDWLVGADGEEDALIAPRLGGEVVGALALRLEPGHGTAATTPAGRRRGRAASLRGVRGGRGVIRAWTTALRYRGRGLGEDMLHEAVRVTRERCGRDAQVGFAREHANSRMVLPEMFNGTFRRSEMRAAKALEKVLARWEGNRRKR